MTTVIATPLGAAIPQHLPHAISVSLPTWQDNVDYEEGRPRVMDAMVNGYPRFFINKIIQRLAQLCEQKFSPSDGSVRCMLFPLESWAAACREFMLRRDPSIGSVRLVHFKICSETSSSPTCDHPPTFSETKLEQESGDLHVVLFPSNSFHIAKQFWQHTGLGISSRYAAHCLELLANEGRRTISTPTIAPMIPSPTVDEFSVISGKSPRNRHYRAKSVKSSMYDSKGTPGEDQGNGETVETYLEERYARNLPISAVAEAKRALRTRIASVLVRNDKLCSGVQNGTLQCSESINSVDGGSVLPSAAGKSSNERTTRGSSGITEGDVFLFPTGMSAIWYAHQLALRSFGERKSVCFGFPYVDTLKVLEKWGPGAHFFGHGSDEDIDALERLLTSPSPPQDLSSSDSHQLPSSSILALFCEFPSNPLLRSPNLKRLRALADEHNFLIVVDETVGSFVNVHVLPDADMIATSLTKIFSGDTNVMGGGLVLNPRGRHYQKLKETLQGFYEDGFWGEDAIYLERNSRNFEQRVQSINRNTLDICTFLETQSLEARPRSASDPQFDVTEPKIIKKVYYPAFITPDTYEEFRIPHSNAGYGHLFSLTFTHPVAARAFFDALGCEKGPSLGTNFTLSCPFVILAHYAELEWARSYDVDPDLVRVSVGLEDAKMLRRWFENALDVARKVVEEEVGSRV